MTWLEKLRERIIKYPVSAVVTAAVIAGATSYVVTKVNNNVIEKSLIANSIGEEDFDCDNVKEIYVINEAQDVVVFKREGCQMYSKADTIKEGELDHWKKIVKSFRKD